MKILYLTDNRSIHNRRFLEKLLLSGHEIWSWNLTATESPGLKSELPAGVHFITSTKKVEPASPSEYQKLLPQLKSVFDELRPSLIHAGPIQSAGYLAALSDFHPTLLMSWGSDILLEADRNAEWKSATELALRKADAFFCDCETARKKAITFRVFQDSRIVQFPWGLKPGVFSPRGPLPPSDKLAPKPGTTTLIYTRSYDPLYGTDVLLEGFRKAQTAHPALRLLLVGHGSQSPGLTGYIQTHGLNDVVLQIGPQPDADLPSWFRAADAYISCAKSDGTSVSLLEAMATGLAVIATDISSNREWITEPDNGFLADSGSSKAVAEKILEVTKLTPQQRQAIADRNQRIVAERANWDKNFPRLLEMYERLVQKPLV